MGKETDQHVENLHYNIRTTRAMVRNILQRIETMDADIKVIKARAAMGAIYREIRAEAREKENHDTPETP